MIEISKALMSLGAALCIGLAAAPLWHGQDCGAAGSAVAIQANPSGTDTITVRYSVVNHTEDSLRWISIGAGREDERTVAVPVQTPVVVEAPAGWRGQVVYPEETAYVHLWWEAADSTPGLGPGGSLSSFVVRAAGASAVQPGQVGPYGPVHPIDFARLPFTVGGPGGRCWWGRVTPVP
jgi:hypothetical protein